MEEEQKRRRQELLSIFLKIKMTKEEEMTRTNTHKLNDRWRTIMRDLKSKELIEDLELLRQVFESQLDKKEEMIRRLFKEVEEGDEQHNIAVRTHMQNLEMLVDQHRGHLRECRDFFDSQLGRLSAHYDGEMGELSELQQVDMDYLADIIHKIDTDVAEADKETGAEFQTKSEEVKNKNIEERTGLKYSLEVVIEGHWDHFQRTVRSYYEETEGRRKVFDELKSREETSMDTLANQVKKIHELQDDIKETRQKLAEEEQEHVRKTSSLKDDRLTMKEYLRCVKTDVGGQRNHEDHRIKQLTVVTNDVMKQLQERERLADRILRLSECCRKLETEEQKIMPFLEAPLSDLEQQAVDAAILQRSDEPLADALAEYSALENFWRRFNTALLDKTALAMQRADLRSENQQLQKMLRDYMEDLRAGTANKADGILPTVTASSLQLPQIRRPGSINVIEAALVAKNLVGACSGLPPCYEPDDF